MNKPTQPGPSSPVACLLPEVEQKARRDTFVHEILASALDIQELKDGILLRLPGTDAWFSKLADFISFERAGVALLIGASLRNLWLKRPRPERLVQIRATRKEGVTS